MTDEPAVGARRAWSGILLAAMAWLTYLFLLVPNIVVLPMSFGNQYAYEFPPRSLSLVLYQKLLADPQWTQAIWLSLKVAVCTALLSLGLGVPAAYGLARGNYPGKRAIMIFLMSPMLVPIIVIALGIYLHFAKLKMIGSMVGLVLAHTLYCIPFVLATSMAGMRHIDARLEAAAEIMGASRVTIFLRITLPLLKPAIFAGAIFAFIMSFDEVVIAFFILDPTSFTLPVKMYSSIQFDASPILAAVSSLLTVLSIAVCTMGALVQRRMR